MNFDAYRRYTQSRIGLGHKGPSLPTKALLSFAYDHACAVDALNLSWELPTSLAHHQTAILHTKVRDRNEYLMRPDLGRELDDASREKLASFTCPDKSAILVSASNGLSSRAVENHLAAFLSALFTLFQSEKLSLMGDCVFLIPNGRVGLIDALGDILKPSIGLIIIGERPGLSSNDSLAVYLTYEPKLCLSNAERNCISNIRPPHGLSYEEASIKTLFLIKEAIRRKLSGVMLKEEAGLLTGEK